jgi:type I restriction enzyme, S subunit
VDQALIVADCVRLRVDESKANKQYVMWILNSEPMLDQIARRGKGATRQRVNLSDFKTVQIPLPPLSEQERVVRVLDEAEALRRLRAQADERTSRIIGAMFVEMFGEPSTNPKGWPIQRAGELMTLCEYGTSKKSSHTGPGVPILRMNNVTAEGLLDLSDMKVVELATGS